MGKKDSKTSAGRLKKKKVMNWLMDLFNAHPEREINVKELFAALHASNHPAKMVVIEALSDLVLDDFLATDGHGNYRNTVRSNVMEGTFVRKRNGHNAFVPDDGGSDFLVYGLDKQWLLDNDDILDMELKKILEEQGSCHMTCQFCDAEYEFTAPQLRQLIDNLEGKK